jgi:hypothetical protein
MTTRTCHYLLYRWSALHSHFKECRNRYLTLVYSIWWKCWSIKNTFKCIDWMHWALNTPRSVFSRHSRTTTFWLDKIDSKSRRGWEIVYPMVVRPRKVLCWSVSNESTICSYYQHAYTRSTNHSGMFLGNLSLQLSYMYTGLRRRINSCNPN